MVDNSFILIENIVDGEDEDEYIEVVMAPTLVALSLAPWMLDPTAASTTPLFVVAGGNLGVAAMGSSFSPSAAPFHPGARSAGRPKVLLWSKDVDDSSNYDSVSPPPLLSCALATAGKSVPSTSVPTVDGPSVEAQGNRRSRRGQL
jgi:hypothetical protein